MKFNNLPAKVKRTPEQNAIGAFKAGNTYAAMQIILGDMSVEEIARFGIHALKKTKFKSYRMGIENLENAVETFILTKDVPVLKKAQKSFSDTSDIFSGICTGIMTMLITPQITEDLSWVASIPYNTYEYSYGQGFEKLMLADILAFKYNNTNFGLLYAGT